MTQAFERLQRVIELEAKQGYKNKAVVGGIRQFVIFWAEQAREESADESDQFFIDVTAEMLANYHRLPGVEARAQMLTTLLTKLKERNVKESSAEPPKPLPAPAPVAKPASANKPAPRAESAKKATPSKPEPVQTPSTKPAPNQDRPISPSLQLSYTPNPEKLKLPVNMVKGVGPKTGELLEKIGVKTISDLLNLKPRRYDDYSQLKPIHRLSYGETVTVIGMIERVQLRRTRENLTMLQAVVNDGTGLLQLTWFNQPWLEEKLKSVTTIVLSGTVEQYLGRPVLNNPEWEPLSEEQLNTNRIVPIYPLTKGLGATQMRRIMYTAVGEWGGNLPDFVPSTVQKKRKLLVMHEAIENIHFPRNHELLREATRRFAYDEMFLLQLGMMQQRLAWQKKPALPLVVHEGERIRFFRALPFDPTAAQKRVVGEISADMARSIPMNRLLQGDVGAGKTVVAGAALVIAVKAGAQAALMAPTEILAEQHHKGLAKLLAPLGVRVELLTGGSSASEKERIYKASAEGTIDVLIGTTTLIQPRLKFRQLGLVVIDEQHRFGVDQRGQLRDKGVGEHHPHLLVMTATPIPRSLALSLFGDLELSVLDQMPPGRQEIVTQWFRPSERLRVYEFMRRQIAQGRQGYMIFPLVEESDKLDVKAAVGEHERLQKEIFPEFRLGLLHGRMSSAEKESVMRRFYAHEVDLLISTTVIEVGIDVPNSTVIVIEGANRFGLAQLHQLRGRVGRGQHKSYCILVADDTSEESAERLQALVDTNDGFQLAEKDLALRGPGEFFGRRQSGLPELALASLFDVELLQSAREDAQKLIADDPTLEKEELKWLRDRVTQFWENAGDVS